MHAARVLLSAKMKPWLIAGVLAAALSSPALSQATIEDTEITYTTDADPMVCTHPATVTAGELLIYFLNGTSGGTAGSFTTPGSVTQLYQDSTGFGKRVGVFWKTADGTEDGTTLNFSQTDAKRGHCAVIRISNHSGIDVDEFSAISDTGTTFDCPTATIAGTNELVLCVLGENSDGATGTLATAPGSTTAAPGDGSLSTLNGQETSIVYYTQPSGATGAKQWTNVNSGSSRFAFQIAVANAGGSALLRRRRN
jgi:hypothetical protein